jgi:hypothetical protein
VLLAVLGGYLGSLFTAFNTWVCVLRKRWSRWFSFRVLEVGAGGGGAGSGRWQMGGWRTLQHQGGSGCPPPPPRLTALPRLPTLPRCSAPAGPTQVCVLSVLTSALFFALPLAGRCRACTSPDAEHCVGGRAAFRTFSGYRCGEGTYNDLAVLVFNPQVGVGGRGRPEDAPPSRPAPQPACPPPLLPSPLPHPSSSPPPPACPFIASFGPSPPLPSPHTKGYVIQALFAAPTSAFSLPALVAYSGVYYLLAALTYGAFIPSGLFTVRTSHRRARARGRRRQCCPSPPVFLLLAAR